MAISAQTGSNWFMLILQTAKLSTKKESSCYAFQDLSVEKNVGLGFDNGCLAEGHTEAAMCVKCWLQKFDLQILKSVTCLGFFNIKEFYQGWNLGCFWWNFFLNINLICCTYQSFCITFTNVFLFSPQFFSIMKKLCKRAMTLEITFSTFLT